MYNLGALIIAPEGATVLVGPLGLRQLSALKYLYILYSIHIIWMSTMAHATSPELGYGVRVNGCRVSCQLLRQLLKVESENGGNFLVNFITVESQIVSTSTIHHIVTNLPIS